MSVTVEATYENGVLKLLQPLPLAEHEKVKVTVHAGFSVAEQTAGLLKWAGDPAVLRQVAEEEEFGILEAP
jgi:predicted DNA-binding antitoxin AbrB/MazE fold protein